MRVRPHIETMAALEFRRTEVIEEHERTHRAAARMRQCPAHREAVEIDRTRHHHGFEGIAGETIAGGRVLAGEKAHGTPPMQALDASRLCRSGRSQSQTIMRQAEFACPQCRKGASLPRK